ncbi:MAG: cation:proton antiporter, partial [Sinomicrobium sp.]|nr:cation:proton antiporter [Sinomicrobium sp.]
VLLVFVEADLFAHESGLLAVVVMGLFLGNSDLPSLKELLYFKESLSVLLISILFILLSANVNIEDLEIVFRWETAALMAVIIFLLRPLGVFLSTRGSKLKTNEKLFISWVGPRGIVAAGIASLFGSKLVLKGEPGAEYITPLVFTTVLVTVLLNAATARFFARLIGVFLQKSNGILIVGASQASRLIGKYLQDNERHVVLIDSNKENVEKSRALGLDAMEANIYSEDLADNVELSDIGYLMALTASKEVNTHAIHRFKKQLGENGAFRLIAVEEMKSGNKPPPEILFSSKDDYINLIETARDYPRINELPTQSGKPLSDLLKRLDKEKGVIPLFIKDKEGELHLIPAYDENKESDAECHLVYLGKPEELLS